MTYRQQAKKSVERAKKEINTGDEERLKYAALELRMAFECLIFDRAKLYQAEMTSIELSQWQPVKILQMLIAIDCEV